MRVTATSAAHASKILFTAPVAPKAAPIWARAWLAERAVTASRVGAVLRLPDLTVISVKEPASLLAKPAFLEDLAQKHRQAPKPSQLVFVFDRGPISREQLMEVLGYFTADRIAEILFAHGAEQAMLVVSEVEAKRLVLDQHKAKRRAHPPAADPLAELADIAATTQTFRADSGRLSAEKLAPAFGISLAELAHLVGRSRQSVSKTPDAPSLQQGLQPFARTARLLSHLSAADFKAWLQTPNTQLDGLTPLEAIRQGEGEVVADLADDMLSGSPA